MLTLKIEGMHCGHCAQSVKEALEGLPGAVSLEVDLALGEARLRGDVDPKLAIAAVEAEGYSARLA